MTKFFVAAHALIERDSRFLATRRSVVNDYMPGKWDIPGGSVDPGETCEEAVLREVHEEAGLVISIRRPIFVYTNRDQVPTRQTFQLVFLAKFIGGNVTLNPDEHDDYKWLSPAELLSLDSIAFLRALTDSDAIRDLGTH